MQTISIIITLVFLFYLLSKAADIAIVNIKSVGKSLGIHVFFLGLILGIFTSLPETSLGINSIINNLPNLSLGNLLGGTIVLLGLVLPLSIILNKNIKTEKNWSEILLIILSLVPPMLASLDGRISGFDGIILVIIYISVIVALYFQHRNSMEFSLEINKEENNVKSLLLIVIALIMVMLLSSAIVRFAETLLSILPISQFILGLLMFAIGTNLPELIVAIRAYKNHSRELSMGNIIGSAMANTLLIGIFAMIKPFDRPIDPSFFILSASLTAILLVFFIAYRTGNRLSRIEGFILLTIFGIYIAAEILLINLKA